MTLDDAEFLRLLQYLESDFIGSTPADFLLGKLLHDGRAFYTHDTVPKINKIKRKFKYYFKYAKSLEKTTRLGNLIGHVKIGIFKTETIRELEIALFGDISDMLLLVNSEDMFIKQIVSWRLKESV